MDLGSRIKNLRNKKNITQDMLSKAINVDISTVGKYEININRPSIDILVKIADYFNVTTDYLLNRIDFDDITRDDLILFHNIRDLKE